MRASETRRVLRNACRSVFEPLEGRRYLSTINWTNKGTGAGAGDTDDFNLFYGANATAARNIVQRAIDDWEKVIVDFNYSGGGNTFSVEISAAAIGGRGGTSGITTLAGKPTSADIQLDDNGGGAGWYFDPVIGSANVPDDSEFTTFVTPFMASFTGAGAGNDDDDLYRTIAHELGHAMGISGGSSLLLDDNFTDVGDDPLSGDPADRLFAWNINGGGVEATFTDSGGIHFFEGPAPAGGTAHPNELLNSGRTVGAPPTTRQLISDLTATVLRDAYDYTVKLPSTINTFYANLNTATNRVTVTGDMDFNNDDNDNIDLEVTDSLTAMSFEVNGTDEIIEGAEFSSIVVNAGAAGDDIDVDELLATRFVTINGDAGNDLIQIAPEFGDVGNNLLSDLTTDGGTGTDTLTFNDSSDPVGNDDYTFFSPTVACGSHITVHFDMERLELFSSREASVFNINATSSTYSLDIIGSAGTDTFNIAEDDYDSQIIGDISIDGLTGADVLNINDDADAGTGTYNLDHFDFSKTSGGGTLSYDSISNLVLNGSGQTSLYNVDMGGATVDGVTINAGAGNDTLDLGGTSNDIDNAMATLIDWRGQGGTDKLDLSDVGDSADNGETYNLTGVDFTKSSAGGELVFAGTEQIHLVGNGGTNTITVEFGNLLADQSVTVGGGGGDDLITSLAPGAFSLLLTNVTLQGGAGNDTLRLDDIASPSDDYTITADTVQVTGPVTSGLITYTTEVLDLTTSNVASLIRVQSTAAGTDYSIDAGLGDDTFNFGGAARDVGANLGDVDVFGGGGNDRINYNDDGPTLGFSYTVSTNNLFRAGTGNVDPSGVESLVVNTSGGADDVSVQDVGTSMPVTVNGNAGGDTLRVATGFWDFGIVGPVTVNGGGGTDVVVIDDSNDTGADGYAVTATQATKNTVGLSGAINYATVESFRLDANGDANTINVDGTFNGNFDIRGRGGADTINVNDNFAGTFVNVDGGTGLDTVTVNTDGIGVPPASAQFNNSQDLAQLNIGFGGTVRHNASNLLLDVQGMNNAGVLNLTDGGFIDRGGFAQIGMYQTMLTTGFNGGLWNGAAPSIVSSTASTTPLSDGVGYAGAGGIGIATFMGSTVAPNDLVLRYTLNGDTNLDQAVDIADFANLTANFNAPSTWARGNFNYDALTDISDFALLSANFNQSVPPPAPRMAPLFGTTLISEEIRT